MLSLVIPLIILISLAAIVFLIGQDKDDSPSEPDIYRRQHVNHMRHVR